MAINLNDVIRIGLRDNTIKPKAFSILNENGEIIVPEQSLDSYLFNPNQGQYTESEFLAVIEHGDLNKLPLGATIKNVYIEDPESYKYSGSDNYHFTDLRVINNDNIYDMGIIGDGTVIFAASISERSVVFGNNNIYKNSTLRTYCNDFTDQLTNINDYIVPFSVSSNGETLIDKGFSLSEYEVFNRQDRAKMNEGKTFGLFYRQKLYAAPPSTSDAYWSRSAWYSGSTNACLFNLNSVGSFVMGGGNVTSSWTGRYRPCFAMKAH